MGLRARLADPWTLFAGGISAAGSAVFWGAIGGAEVAAGAGLTMGAAVWGITVGVDAISARQAPRSPALTGPARAWVVRAERAVRVLGAQTGSPTDPFLLARLSDVTDRAEETLGDLRRLGREATAVQAARRQVDAPRLRTEANRLSRLAARATDRQVWGAHRRALAAVEEQLAVGARLAATEEVLFARMQSTTYALEGLTARLAEVLALATMAGASDLAERSLTGLADDLGGMRAGLVEAEAQSRRALGHAGGTTGLP